MKFDKALAIAAFAEFCGSAMVISMGCLGSYENTMVLNSNLQRALTWGFAVLMATQSFAGLSGAHISPCISLAAMIVKVVDIPTGAIYILMQLLGSFAGFSIAYGLAPRKSKSFCCTLLGHGIVWYKGLLIEAVITSVWTFIMLASWHPGNENFLESVSIRIGLGVAACNVAAAYFTGASMNPFRSLPPAVFGGQYKDIWIYMVMPPIAAVIIAVFWRFVILRGEASSSE